MQTATETSDGGNQFDMTFAGAIGYDGLTVTSDATVAWGSPAGLATLPIIFSQCEWESFGEPGFVEDGGFLHHGSSALNNELPPTAGYPYRDRYTTIYVHGPRKEPVTTPPAVRISPAASAGSTPPPVARRRARSVTG